MQKINFLFLFLTIIGCRSLESNKSETLKLKFLDEYILPKNTLIEGTVVGGLSGIDYKDGTYYLVCDDAKNPRIYKAQIDIYNSQIENIDIQNEIEVKDSIHYLDLESIRYDEQKRQIFLTSEGHINTGKDPLFFSVDQTGNLKKIFNLPKAFMANSLEKPRHNATLEGLSLSVDKKGYWIAMELPLEIDGPAPKLKKTKSPIRITYIEAVSGQVKNQFAYYLDSISKRPKENFAVNGLSDILEYKKNKFFVIERSYSSGLGTQGNTIKIFNVNATNATNTLALKSLKNTNITAASKELLFNFEQVRGQLTDNIIDNIEGITFGPNLPNGNKSLVLVSDNNFNNLGKQLNQFILLEIID